jgi:hypothetical protein
MENPPYLIVVDALPVTTMSTADQLTQQERQAYILLSEFFLDTELTPLDLHRLSASLHPLGTAATLQHMLRYDLFPILYPT